MNQNKTKICHNCGAEVPENAAYCDICGASLLQNDANKQSANDENSAGNGVKKMKPNIIMICVGAGLVIALIVAGLLISGYASRIKYEMREKRMDLSDWPETVTVEEYEKIEIGMTYDEVKDIVGGDGKLIEDEKYWITYRWPGEYYTGKYNCFLELEFQKPTSGELKGSEPTVYQIYEREILRGSEHFDTNKKLKEGNYFAIDTEYISREQASKIEAGMTYEEVCEVLETEGKLLNSSTYKTDYRIDTNEEYVWKCRSEGRDYIFTQNFEDGVVKNLFSWQIENID